MHLKWKISTIWGRKHCEIQAISPFLKLYIFSAELYGNGSLSQQQILDSSKMKQFAENNFEFDENGGKFSKRVKNNVAKGEIARLEQFLLFPQCFQKTCKADT